MEQQLKLSEAIRKGAKLRPMGKGAYFKWDRDEGYCSCALGAAYESTTSRFLRSLLYEPSAKAEARILRNLESTCPDLPRTYCISPLGTSISLHNVIAIMNDSGKFTREEIADWLESAGE